MRLLSGVPDENTGITIRFDEERNLLYFNFPIDKKTEAVKSGRSGFMDMSRRLGCYCSNNGKYVTIPDDIYMTILESRVMHLIDHVKFLHDHYK